MRHRHAIPLVASALLALAGCATLLGLNDPLPKDASGASTQAVEASTPSDASDAGTMNVPDGPFCKGKEIGFCDDFQDGSVRDPWMPLTSTEYVTDLGATELGAMRVYDGSTHIDRKTTSQSVEFSFKINEQKNLPGTSSNVEFVRNAGCRLRVTISIDGTVMIAGDKLKPSNLNCSGDSTWHHVIIAFRDNSDSNFTARCDERTPIELQQEACGKTDPPVETLYINANTPGVLIDDVWMH
jgi:hypothetical protein